MAAPRRFAEQPMHVAALPNALAILVMGVAGCGKTVVGEALAARLNARFLEGDSLHPAENIARMSAGLPLTDEFRAGWLDRIATEMASVTATGRSVVAACSALKRIYRDRLRALNPDLMIVYLDIDQETARKRVGSRKGHFMPASLVDSQFADLQPPSSGERAVTLDSGRSLDDVVARATTFIQASH